MCRVKGFIVDMEPGRNLNLRALPGKMCQWQRYPQTVRLMMREIHPAGEAGLKHWMVRVGQGHRSARSTICGGKCVSASGRWCVLHNIKAQFLSVPPCIKCMSLFCCFLLRVEMYASVLTWRRPNSKKHDCCEEWGLLVKLRWSLFLSSHACYAMKGIKDLCPTNKMSFNTKRSTGYKKLQREVHLLIIILVLL